MAHTKYGRAIRTAAMPMSVQARGGNPRTGSVSARRPRATLSIEAPRITKLRREAAAALRAVGWMNHARDAWTDDATGCLVVAHGLSLAMEDRPRNRTTNWAHVPAAIESLVALARALSG